MLKNLLPALTMAGIVTFGLVFGTPAQSSEAYVVYSEGELTDMVTACNHEPLQGLRTKCQERVEALRITYDGIRQALADAEDIRGQVMLYPSVAESLDHGL